MRPSACALAAALAAMAPAALAHPLPRTASPAPNALLTASPAEIRITFSEGLVGAFSGLQLKDAAGKVVAIGPAKVDPHDSRQLSAPVKARLGPGAYAVSWRVVGDDSHRVAGSYGFRLR